MTGITGFGHIAIKVADLQRSIDWYARIGMDEVLRLNNDAGEPWIIYLRLSDTQFLELFPGAEGEHLPTERGNGVNHLCFAVENIEAATEKWKAAGIELTSPVKSGIDGNKGAWITDPDGNRIELMEMAPACIQYEAVKRFHAQAG